MGAVSHINHFRLCGNNSSYACPPPSSSLVMPTKGSSSLLPDFFTELCLPEPSLPRIISVLFSIFFLPRHIVNPGIEGKLLPPLFRCHESNFLRNSGFVNVE